MALKDSTMMNIILVLGALVSFIFTVLTFAFAGDIALYTMAVKADIFWESEYGYSDWNESSESGTTQTTYKDEADSLETDSINAMMNAVSAVSIAGSLITLVLIALVFFRKEGGLIYMFKGVGGN